jgi:hypothetical protein
MPETATETTHQGIGDVLDFLRRDDKWYLGGGGRLLWTPPYPEWLETMGFWDEAHYFQYQLPRAFTITLLDEEGREIPYRFEERTWRPDVLEQSYSTKAGLRLFERKAMHPKDVLLSVLRIDNESKRPRKLKLVAWSVRDHKPSGEEHFVDNVGVEERHLRFRLHTQHRNLPKTDLGCAMGSDRAVSSVGVHYSQGAAMQPRWRYTPFFESIDEDGLADQLPDRICGDDGLVYMGMMVELDVPAGGEAEVAFGFAAAPDAAKAVENIIQALAEGTDAATRAWEDYYDKLPAFQCSDPFLTKYYYYRWFGLRLFTYPGGEGNYRYPAIAEGLSYFRLPITYSAQCHILETRWMDSPAIGQGSLLNFIHNQRPNGGFPGHIYVSAKHEESFYHANWANIRFLHTNHPDDDFLREAYDGLSRYARYFDDERDPEGTGLYDIQNMYETGQEYMHRYVAVEEHADQDYWGSHFRLKGVDVAIYMYEIKRLLAWIAAKLGDDTQNEWTTSAEKTKRAILEEMWDPDEQMFFDVDPRSGSRTGVKAAVCFYPYFTDIVDKSHLPGLKRNLLDPDIFWTAFPVPSSSQDDPFFDHQARWKGQRRNCPWNGRVWPMTNSHIAEALAVSAQRFDDDLLRKKATEFIRRFVQMMFYDGDVDRPNCYEHYNPISGKACEYRGVDDYQHSWVNELLIKYVAGIRPEQESIVIDPLPFGFENVRIENVPVRGHRISVEITGNRVKTYVDGMASDETTIGSPLSIDA